MVKVPDECYKKYGADLDGCSTQEREGCGSCVLAKRPQMDNTDLIAKARELCDRGKEFDKNGRASLCKIIQTEMLRESLSTVGIITNALCALSIIPQLCDALEAARKEIERLKTQCDINATSFFDMREQFKNATAERDTYKAALQNWNEQEGK